MRPEQDLARGRAGPGLGPDGPSSTQVAWAGAPSPQPAPRSQPPTPRTPPCSVLQRTFSESSPADRTLAQHGGWRPRPQADSAGTVLFSRQKLGGHRASGMGQSARTPAGQHVGGLAAAAFSAPAALGRGSLFLLQPPDWSPGGLCTFGPCTRPWASRVVSSGQCSGRPREASGAWGGYTGAGQVERNERSKRSLVLEPTGGVGWARLGLHTHGAAKEVRTCRHRVGMVAALGSPSRSREALDVCVGGAVLLCFPVTTTEEGHEDEPSFPLTMSLYRLQGKNRSRVRAVGAHLKNSGKKVLGYRVAWVARVFRGTPHFCRHLGTDRSSPGPENTRSLPLGGQRRAERRRPRRLPACLPPWSVVEQMSGLFISLGGHPGSLCPSPAPAPAPAP